MLDNDNRLRFIGVVSVNREVLLTCPTLLMSTYNENETQKTQRNEYYNKNKVTEKLQ